MASDLQKILAKQKKQCYHSQQLGDIVVKAGKETLTFRGRQEYSVTDCERCLEIGRAHV